MPSTDANASQPQPSSCETPIPRGTHGRTGYLLAKLGAVILEMADDALAPTGLDGRSYCVVATLAVDGPDSQQRLAELMGLTPGAMVALIDQLETAGLVERNRDPRDRRRSRVTLTEAGERALADADQIAETVVAQLLSGLERAEIAQVGALLSRGLGVDA